MRKSYNGIVVFYGIWVLILIILPLLIVFVISFLDGDIYNLSSVSFTLDNYKQAFSKDYFGVVTRSVLMALYCNIICLVIGYPVAYIISGLNPKYRNIMVLLLLAPMWSNFLLRTYSWMVVLGNNGPINSFITMLGFNSVQLMYNDFGVILGMVYNFLPFMVLPIYLSLTRIDKGLVEAAQDLGATNRYVFTKVKLPLSIPGIFSGTTLVFLPAITSFVISRLLGGGQYILVGNLIEHKLVVQQEWQVGSAIAVVLMIILLAFLAVLRKIAKNKLELSLW
jgi:spermidine/putrescine transport system permease protein